jgi:DNA-binding transcriptional ArsR family regulator
VNPMPGPLFKYPLTRICSVEYIKNVESVFEVIAEPNRQAILNLQVTSQQSVGDIERQLGVPQTAVSKQLRVLRDAGFVESTASGDRRLAGSVPSVLVRLRRCSRTLPQPHGPIDTDEKNVTEKEDAA